MLGVSEIYFLKRTSNIFYPGLDVLHLLYNQLKLIHMKSSAVEITFKVWAIGLGIIAFGGILISIFNVIVGNYVGTASFEF